MTLEQVTGAALVFAAIGLVGWIVFAFLDGPRP